MPQTVIDYTFTDTATTAGVPAGVTVRRLSGGPDCNAEEVVSGDRICVNGLKATVDEVGSVVVNDDGTKEARTILSGGA